jgi:hypothetical protein
MRQRVLQIALLTLVPRVDAQTAPYQEGSYQAPQICPACGSPSSYEEKLVEPDIPHAWENLTARIDNELAVFASSTLPEFLSGDKKAKVKAATVTQNR